MPRRARFTVEDGIYHVMVRGNNRNTIFHDDEDFKYFKKLMKETKDKYNLKIYHYVLMNNHVHVIIQAAKGKDLSEGIKRINVIYAAHYRRKYKGIGHFFQDRFKSYLIQNGLYLLESGRYIELNPVKAGIVKKPDEYRWSSYCVYSKGKGDGIVDISPEYKGLSWVDGNRRHIYKEFVEAGRAERRDEERYFRSGVYGTENFMKDMKKKGLKPLWSHKGKPKKVSRSR